MDSRRIRLASVDRNPTRHTADFTNQALGLSTIEGPALRPTEGDELVRGQENRELSGTEPDQQAS
jgi:hypothetical protein